MVPMLIIMPLEHYPNEENAKQIKRLGSQVLDVRNIRKNRQIYWKQIKAIKSKQNFNKTSSKIIHNGFGNVGHIKTLIFYVCDCFCFAAPFSEFCCFFFHFLLLATDVCCDAVVAAGGRICCWDYHFYLYSFEARPLWQPTEFHTFCDNCVCIFLLPHPYAQSQLKHLKHRFHCKHMHSKGKILITTYFDFIVCCVHASRLKLFDGTVLVNIFK